MANVLLVGLDAATASELTGILRQLGQEVLTAAPGAVAGLVDTVNLVFTPEELLAGVQQELPGVPVIVVSRVPEVSNWLQALEHGASDYCGAPFELRSIRWALNSSLSPSNRCAA
jgi:DNA-binding response OmpR family regulator